MLEVKRSFLSLGLRVKIDEEGWLQEASLIKEGSYPKYKPGEFKFDLNKVKGITAFQKKVYSKLVNVPSGETVTYKDLASLAGCPGASRAVGTAMAKNKVVLFMPCHRVVRSSGGLGNYSGFGGVKTKSLLLEFEKSGGSI